MFRKASERAMVKVRVKAIIKMSIELRPRMWTEAARAGKLQVVRIVPKVKIICWTTTNGGREVAYIEDDAVSGVTLLHHVDEQGVLHSRELKERIQHEQEGPSLREGNDPIPRDEGILLGNRR